MGKRKNDAKDLGMSITMEKKEERRKESRMAQGSPG